MAKGPHIIPETTAGCRVGWMASPPLPVGLPAQRRAAPGGQKQAVGGFVGLGRRANPSNVNELMYET